MADKQGRSVSLAEDKAQKLEAPTWMSRMLGADYDDCKAEAEYTATPKSDGYASV